jgi:pyruvyl transferase EpsI
MKITNFIRQQIRPICQWLYNNTLGPKRIFIFGIPQHGNIGDQAIAEATYRFINKYTNRIIVEIPMERSREEADNVLKDIRRRDVVAWHGGGNLGTIWANEEKCRLDVLPKFRHKKIIIFPQSVYFDKGSSAIEKSRSVYNNLPGLTLFVRENKSFSIACQLFAKTAVMMVPDIVFAYEYPVDRARKGAITLFRSDKEKQLNSGEQDQIIELLKTQFQRFTQSDTVIDKWYTDLSERQSDLDQLLDNIASHRVVITDRLHGMIFAYITNTPCIVLENSNHKIKATYDTWLKGNASIRRITTARELPSALREVLASTPNNQIFGKDKYHKLIRKLK